MGLLGLILFVTVWCGLISEAGDVEEIKSKQEKLFWI